MPATYSVTLNRDASASTATLGAIVVGSTNIRPIELLSISITCPDTPADRAYKVEVLRCLTEGTGSAVTPSPLDLADAASSAEAYENHTVEPPYDWDAGAPVRELPLIVVAGTTRGSSVMWESRGRVVRATEARTGFGLRVSALASHALQATVVFREA